MSKREISSRFMIFKDYWQRQKKGENNTIGYNIETFIWFKYLLQIVVFRLWL